MPNLTINLIVLLGKRRPNSARYFGTKTLALDDRAESFPAGGGSEYIQVSAC